jgi:hypothetical protein
LGPNGSTSTLADAINGQAFWNQNIVLTLYSGSAQAFATGVDSGMINQNTLSKIIAIVYISPGAPGGFANTDIPSYTAQSFKWKRIERARGQLSCCRQLGSSGR